MGGVVAAATLVAVATRSITTAVASVPTVDISVASLIPGQHAAATAAFNAQIKLFEQENPGIKVTPSTYQWLGSTFAAKLAAGTLPTMFTVPFTDGRSLGENGQLFNLSTLRRGAAVLQQVQPRRHRRGHQHQGPGHSDPRGLLCAGNQLQPQALHRGGASRGTTAHDLGTAEADAKQISDRTGMAGRAEMGAKDNTAGSILTALDYALGGRMETGIGADARRR